MESTGRSRFRRPIASSWLQPANIRNIASRIVARGICSPRPGRGPQADGDRRSVVTHPTVPGNGGLHRWRMARAQPAVGARMGSAPPMTVDQEIGKSSTDGGAKEDRHAPKWYRQLAPEAPQHPRQLGALICSGSLRRALGLDPPLVICSVACRPLESLLRMSVNSYASMIFGSKLWLR